MKRLIDICLSLIAFLLLSPVIICVAVLVRFKLGSPMLFRQTRPGLHGKPFKMMKFRTMLDAVDAQGNPLPDEVRLTSFGKLLRSTIINGVFAIIFNRAGSPS